MKSTLNIQKMILIMFLVYTIFMAMSSSSFFSIWMSLEMNMFFFIPILTLKMMKKMEESMMMYLLMQSISSTIMLSIILMKTFMKEKMFLSMMYFLILICLFLKMGLFPFHLWMVHMIENMNWTSILILLTIQKVIPLLIMLMMIQKKVILMMCFFNSLTSSFSSMTIFSMRKIFGFSSMNHMTMMILSLIISKKMFKMYLLLYFFITMTTLMLMKNNKMNFIFQMMVMKKKNFASFLNFTMCFFSFMGLPPFLGFLPKMFIFLKMMEMKMFFLIWSLFIFNTIMTYMYMRVIFSSFMLSFLNKKMKSKSKESMLFIFMMSFPMMMIL